MEFGFECKLEWWIYEKILYVMGLRFRFDEVEEVVVFVDLWVCIDVMLKLCGFMMDELKEEGIIVFDFFEFFDIFDYV